MDWWMQVVTDCRRLNQDKTKEQKTPLLIFSKNRAKVYVALPYKTTMYHKLNVDGTTMRTTLVTKDIRGDEQEFDIIITTLDSFATVPIADLQQFGKTVEWDAYADQYE